MSNIIGYDLNSDNGWLDRIIDIVEEWSGNGVPLSVAGKITTVLDDIVTE